MTTSRKFLSKSAKDTINFAAKFAKALKPGDIVALVGNLGAGKTTFTKGIAKGLGVKDYVHVNSPTFVLIKEYKCRGTARRAPTSLYHFDLYRLDMIRDIKDLDADGYFFGKGVSVIEWADKCQALLPKNHIRVDFKIKCENEREIVIR